MRLVDLLKGVKHEIKGNPNVDISGVCYDSRKAKPKYLFIAIKGFKTDGLLYVEEAIKNGAVAVVTDRDISEYPGVTVVLVEDARAAMAKIASNFYNNPTSKLTLIGITGTNGKTSVTYMLKAILEQQNNKVGLVGTIQNMIGDRVIPTTHTTPESLDLQELFSLMVNEGVKYVVMEVSSHSLALHRVDSCDFDIAVFTNLSQDHLDFHESMEEYAKTKSKLFKMAKKASVINIDDKYSSMMIESSKGKVLTYGIKDFAYVMAKEIKNSLSGVKFKVQIQDKKEEISLKIPGLFSVYNALAAITVADFLGIPLRSVREALSHVTVKGRFEPVETGRDFYVFIDYAHTPDGIRNIMEALKEYEAGRKILVFGAGGDRDKSKRPLMGEVAGKYADFCILTSDNPRSENPKEIIAQIEEGIKKTNCPYVVIEDRREAIRYALSNAQKDDVIILAGKGHETYQIIGDKVIPFDEREIVKEILAESEK
ncbi:UDP-N-acetylmuramoyl-L-alanyl-D-glutamate--2,6-diaminopimelate ligase [Caldanaerobacter subterraneus]|jgi:UDP-N-acetylmuramoyl-L-alanyl-D-glutamate--2,6-diaminopimelate ligase|uniref:UDP-N-acetylmuramoyl-L-alanyl-D-glutamate--2,6-diaminopimelate ligase n=4 Tax=Caldanaerobacter subterraneus TaxID=911092 RepID=MURE_CALS4|nr:UDP-N-acetylmuramoyl-L-alanyl-D-glutamate--2,6-diaminopimelate ligase [Caldanaerobacter subterraneus]Q8R9G2.2 RecName: Full=UDP-N-acetylmuramoyl-L-alanyl-D-glutamate--2,6-diaminopimelate ligase; AltName: Full=Meso-A2pm-adding enzyme; AltName: Full=Meso-diaminopimelate-adding enzyme; AltName: Full=UDP-MurNAc-L-Ala-D-Glu:meso-diaminopimelate ligase; AltName: Full=UDP-MurNAc-tripeptide synthetase; AltName: Full=UDP-N-acetylmuramyl-tripeptide synthetase [Caldanaerobacter subterraneus subsp. tengcon